MILIQNGYLIDPKSGREGKLDVLTDGDKVVKIGSHLEKPAGRCQTIDAEGMVVAPGLVDVHVHFRDPGFTYKEDIGTGAAAAARGGFTSVVMMANTNPPIDNGRTLRYVLEKGKETGIHVYSCASVTKGREGRKLAPMEELAGLGAAGFTDDGSPLLNEGLVREAMERAVKLDMPISFHEEDPALILDNGIHHGRASAHFGIGGSPREAEIRLVERDLRLAQETGACAVIQHISTREAVELVRRAKQRGCNVHAEATPHHFTLTEDAVIQYGAMAKMNPPLREEEDRLEIIRGLVDGTIDMIATDHAPHAPEEKAKAVTEAPSGIIGLETSLALGITKLVGGGYMTLKALLARMSSNPAAVYHLNAGYLAEGGPADIVLIDTGAEYVPGDYASKSSNTPFTGWNLKGRVKAVLCGGKAVPIDGAR